MPKVKKTESDKLDFKSCKGALRASLPVDLWQTIKSENMALSDIYRTFIGQKEVQYV